MGQMAKKRVSGNEFDDELFHILERLSALEGATPFVENIREVCFLGVRNARAALARFEAATEEFPEDQK